MSWAAVLWAGLGADTYDQYAQSISRQPVTLVEIDIDTCTRVFGVAPCDGAGVACFNTYLTCKNPASYVRTVKTLSFVTNNTQPFKQGERPYVISTDYLPTEIKDSLTISGRVKIVIADEPDTDYGIDPYISTRTLPAPGTYWKKFIARNPNYQGRPVRIYEGFLGLSRGEYQLRWQGLLDNITYNKDSINAECIDVLKPISDYTLPEAIEVAIRADITTANDELAVTNCSQLSTYTYFRLDDEVIQVNSYNSALDAVDVTRGALNSEKDEHKAGSKLQAIWHRGPENPFDTMLFISSFCGLTSAISTASFAQAKAWPGDDKDIEAYINEPTECDKMLFELADLTNCRIWYDERQKITCKRISANEPGRAFINITDSAHIIEDSASVDYRGQERISRYWMYWGLSPIGSPEETTSYQYLTGAIDAEAESSVFYDRIVEQTFFNRWSHSSEGPGYTPAVARAKSYVQRMLFNRRDPLPIISLKVEIKDSTIMKGDYVQINTDDIETITGAQSNNKYLVTYRDVLPDGVISLKAQGLPTRNIAVIGSSTMADWGSASTAEKIYAYISDSSGYMTDKETLGYHIY